MFCKKDICVYNKVVTNMCVRVALLCLLREQKLHLYQPRKHYNSLII